ncbi:hypothetical protein BpHYR1_051092 [Brachionus plicatilis]|uniref:Uncharacterized protein n=1 Tax=Brachionus plicatilis TaxID=10195 RepID=A0A3M7QFC5_BRAPC|nr:hypothetical protein BpHYR1_051092 [Brachionus plicatilis]
MAGQILENREVAGHKTVQKKILLRCIKKFKVKFFFWTVLWPAGVHTVGLSVGRPLHGRFLFWPIVGRPPHGFLKFGRLFHGRSVLWPALERSAFLKTVHRRPWPANWPFKSNRRPAGQSWPPPNTTQNQFYFNMFQRADSTYFYRMYTSILAIFKDRKIAFKYAQPLGMELLQMEWLELLFHSKLFAMN